MIKQQHVGRTLWLQVQDSLEKMNRKEVDQQFSQVAYAANYVVLDFRGVKTLPCVMAAYLVKLAATLHKTAGRVYLLEAPVDFRFVLHVARLSELFDFRENADGIAEAHEAPDEPAP